MNTWFRITASVPLTVSFPSAIYDLAIEREPVSQRVELMATMQGECAGRILHTFNPWEGDPVEILRKSGIPTQPRTVAELICLCLEKDGRAERVNHLAAKTAQ